MSPMHRIEEKPLEWIGSSYKDLLALPEAIRKTFGYALSAEAVFVLHCFQKKSKSGIATPKADMDIIRARLKAAEKIAKELQNENSSH